MKPHVAVPEGTNGNPIHLDIRDEENFRIELPYALGTFTQWLRRLLTRTQRPKVRRKTKLVFLAQILPADAKNQMIVPGLLDPCDDLGGYLLLQIDAANLRSAGLARGDDFQIL